MEQLQSVMYLFAQPSVDTVILILMVFCLCDVTDIIGHLEPVDYIGLTTMMTSLVMHVPLDGGVTGAPPTDTAPPAAAGPLGPRSERPSVVINGPPSMCELIVEVLKFRVIALILTTTRDGESPPGRERTLATHLNRPCHDVLRLALDEARRQGGHSIQSALLPPPIAQGAWWVRRGDPSGIARRLGYIFHIRASVAVWTCCLQLLRGCRRCTPGTTTPLMSPPLREFEGGPIRLGPVAVRSRSPAPPAPSALGQWRDTAATQLQRLTRHHVDSALALPPAEPPSDSKLATRVLRSPWPTTRSGSASKTREGGDPLNPLPLNA
jgi:hypothetical protein